MKKALLLAPLLVLLSCNGDQSSLDDAAPLPPPPVPGEASEYTVAANSAVLKKLPFEDRTDFDNASRGFLAAIDAPAIYDDEGGVVWQIDQFDFVTDDAPETVNPSLWRQAQLVSKHGLFEVTDGIWQVRGYDLSVMTVIRGETGWIVIDPLTTKETGAAALKLVNDTLGERPVSALIYTHSHADHFGGARGVITQEQADAGLPIIAPHGFSEEAASENVIAGNHMSRRAVMMFGSSLPRSPSGHVSSGLGPALPLGTVSLILPSEEISEKGGRRFIDGVEFEFIDAAGTEAPAELMFYLPEFRALCSAEVATATFHNILTPRGAKARNSLRWSEVIDLIMHEYGYKSDVMFASHHWPIWGADNVTKFLTQQRNTYRYVHDRAVGAANAGLGMVEAAEVIEEPEFLSESFGSRGYYGTLNHNAKAVYQYYFGWWSGNPADYHRLPPEEIATRYVEAMGGEDAVLREGVKAYQKGDYRWAAEVFSHLVFHNQKNKTAKDWLAATFEQIGYQAESGAWRSYFLTGAQELRNGLEEIAGMHTTNRDVVGAVSTRLLFDAMATRLKPGKIKNGFRLNFIFPDTGETIGLDISGDVVVVSDYAQNDAAASLTMNRTHFDDLIVGEAGFMGLMSKGHIQLEGNPTKVMAFMGALETPELWFPVVTP